MRNEAYIPPRNRWKSQQQAERKQVDHPDNWTWTSEPNHRVGPVQHFCQHVHNGCNICLRCSRCFASCIFRHRALNEEGQRRGLKVGTEHEGLCDLFALRVSAFATALLSDIHSAGVENEFAATRSFFILLLFLHTLFGFLICIYLRTPLIAIIIP